MTRPALGVPHPRSCTRRERRRVPSTRTGCEGSRAPRPAGFYSEFGVCPPRSLNVWAVSEGTVEGSGERGRALGPGSGHSILGVRLMEVWVTMVRKSRASSQVPMLPRLPRARASLGVFRKHVCPLRRSGVLVGCKRCWSPQHTSASAGGGCSGGVSAAVILGGLVWQCEPGGLHWRRWRGRQMAASGVWWAAEC